MSARNNVSPLYMEQGVCGCVWEKSSLTHQQQINEADVARRKRKQKRGSAGWSCVVKTSMTVFSLSPGWICSQRKKKKHVTEGLGLSVCGSVVECRFEIQRHLKHTNTSGNIHLFVLQIPSHNTTCHHSYPFLLLIEAIYDVRCTHWLHIGSREAENSSLCSHLISLCHPTPVLFFCIVGAKIQTNKEIKK